MAETRAAEALFRELRRRRRAGVVRALQLPTTELTAVATAAGLSAESATYRRIEPHEARRILVRVLHRDLAYRSKQMSRDDAERLANEILALVPKGRLYTNGSFGEGRGEDHGVSWNPATSATFDTGVIALGASHSVCVWVEDED